MNDDLDPAAYPLTWPVGWPRTPAAERVRAGNKFGGVSFDRARRGLMEEIRRLGGTNVVLSTNQPVRRDGAPYAAQRIIEDPGVAVYFTRRDQKTLVMARDAYTGMADNMRSLALAVDHLRGLERHGGGVMVERAFAGFAALPAPGKKPWRVVFGWPAHAAAEIGAIETRFRELAKSRHPDVTKGSEDAMTELNVAAADARMEAAG